MKLLHTGDWHLGKRLFGVERADEGEKKRAHASEREDWSFHGTCLSRRARCWAASKAPGPPPRAKVSSA